MQHAAIAAPERAPKRETGLWRAKAVLPCAALLSVSIVIAGCSKGEPAPTERGPTGVAERPLGLVLPTASDARLPDGELTEPFARRFLVPDELARGYALGVARDKGGMRDDAQLCAHWLRVGQDDALLASEYVVGSGPECEGWTAMLEWARGAWPSQGELVEAQRASAGRFYTVAVSPYSFRHPLYEAHAGLPTWVLRASRTEPHAAPWRCEPRSVREETEEGASQVAGYACAEGAVAFEHVTAHELAGAAPSARTDALGSFRRWQLALERQYADAIPARLERLERLWSRYPQGVSP